MKTSALKAVYWPAWNRAFAACWQRDRGTVAAKALREEPVDPSLPSPCEIERIAERLRGTNRLSVDHLRHACHLRAIGRDKSSSQLSATDVDRVVALWDLLADPYSIKAVQRWLNPDQDARKRLEWWVEEQCGFSASYIERITTDRFGLANWRHLKTPQLRQLVVSLSNRARTRDSKRPAMAHA